MAFVNNFFNFFTKNTSNNYEKTFNEPIEKIDYGTLSIGKIQRKLNIGFDYAMNIMNALYDNEYVGEENGYKPRKLLCDEKIVWEYINDNLSTFRPSITHLNCLYVSRRINFHSARRSNEAMRWHR